MINPPLSKYRNYRKKILKAKKKKRQTTYKEIKIKLQQTSLRRENLEK